MGAQKGEKAWGGNTDLKARHVCNAVFRLALLLCYNKGIALLGEVGLDLPSGAEELLGCPSSKSDVNIK